MAVPPQFQIPPIGNPYSKKPAPGTPGTVDFSLINSQPVVGGAFGVNPAIPNPLATSTETIAGNIGNLGSIYNLGTGITDLTNKEAASGLTANLPNYGALTSTGSADILSNLKGNIPDDVWRNIQQAGAERGVATGSPGSPNANAAMLRALGLTTLDLENLGQKQLTEAIGRTPVGRPFDPNTMLVTPEQQQAARTGQAYSSAAPVPALRQAALNRASQSGLQAGMSAIGPDSSSKSTDDWIKQLLSGGGGGTGFPFNPPGAAPSGTGSYTPQPGDEFAPGGPYTDIPANPDLVGAGGYDDGLGDIFGDF